MTTHARRVPAIVGYAQSPIVRHAERPLGSLTLDIAQQAIADAGLRPDEIDGFTSSALFASAGTHVAEEGITTVSSSWLAERLGVNPRFCSGFQGYGQLPGAMALAVNAITSGAVETVLVHRALHNPTGQYHLNTMERAAGALQWIAPQGYFGPLAMIGLTYNEYLQRARASRDSMAAVVVEARKNGARIPWSYWHDRPLSVDEYLAAPLLADPICRLDCDLPVQAAAAFVVTTAERARDLAHRPVYVAGIAAGSPTKRRLPQHWPLDDLYEVGTETARRLRDTTGLTARDVDLPQLYDGFSPLVYFWLEVLGLCERGEAHRFVTGGGIDSDAPGGLPVLSGGGALGNGRMHGVAQLLECYLQLSKRAAGRQRQGVTTALACHAAPHLGGIIALANEPA